MPGRRDDWVRVEHPGFAVDLGYPAITPAGHAVERAEERVEAHPLAGDFERVHLSSPESGELYVELAKFPARSADDEYRQHRPHLAARFGSEAVTQLTRASFGGRPAWTYGFRWDEGERAVLLLEVAGDVYRIIYDPRSELNTKVLETLTVSP